MMMMKHSNLIINANNSIAMSFEVPHHLVLSLALKPINKDEPALLKATMQLFILSVGLQSVFSMHY